MDRSSSLTKGVNIHFKHTCDHLWPGLRLSLVKELIKERKILEGSKGDRLFCSKIIHHRGPWSSTQSQSSNSPSGLFKLQAVFFSANYPPLSWPAPSWAVSTTVSRYITAITYHSGSEPHVQSTKEAVAWVLLIDQQDRSVSFGNLPSQCGANK